MSAFNKAIVALVMTVITIVQSLTGFHIAVDEGTLTAILTALTPILVYLIPNYPKG